MKCAIRWRLQGHIPAILAAACGLLSGCNGQPGTGVTDRPTTARRQVPSDDPRSVPNGERGAARPVIRDGSVAPATYESTAPTPVVPTEQQLAAEALSRIGPPAVPMLVEALKSSDINVRKRALEVLLRMGPDAKEAVPDLVGLLDDPDEEIRMAAAKSLGRIGPDAGEAVPALMRALLEGEGAAEPGRLPQ